MVEAKGLALLLRCSVSHHASKEKGNRHCQGEKRRGEYSRAATLSLLTQIFNNTEHLFPATIAIDHFSCHAHGNLFASISRQEALDKQVSHQKTDKDAAVAAVFLLGRVLQVDKTNGPLDNLTELARGQVRLGVVGPAERVVVEGDAVENRHQQQRPVAAALGHGNISIVVDGQENVGDLVKVWKRRSDVAHIRLLHEQKRHARAQQDDAGLGESRKRLVLQIFFPKGNVVVGQPVVFQRFHVFHGEQDIVVAEEGLFGRELSNIVNDVMLALLLQHVCA